MKNIIVSIILLSNTLVGFSQVIEVAFNGGIVFNSGLVHSYEEMIKDENMVLKKYKNGSTNKYVIDLDKKLISLYYNGLFLGSDTITNHKIKKDLIYIDFNDVESLTGKTVTSHIVLNQNKNNKKFPYFTFYFISTVDNTSNGHISL
jgi:hypothetical protein